MVTATPSFPQLPKNGLFQIANATGTAFSTVYTGGANGSKITSLLATSTDTSAHDVQVAITNGGVNYVLGTISVPIGAGNTSGVNSTNLLDPTHMLGLPLDTDGNPYIHLKSASDTLTVSVVVAMTSGKVMNVIAATAADW